MLLYARGNHAHTTDLCFGIDVFLLLLCPEERFYEFLTF
jgi:hypothetical protein